MKKSILYLSSFLLLQNSLLITNSVWGTENAAESTHQKNISLSDAVLIKQAIEKIKKGQWVNPSHYTLQQLQGFSTLELSPEEIDCYFTLVVRCIHIKPSPSTKILDEWVLQMRERGSKENASPRAQYNLGWCYEQGIGGEKDPVQARTWYLKAANQGLPEAQNSLGRCYQYGIGGEKDPVQARACYLKAADQGLPPAQNNLAYCYQYGIGGEKDPVQARFWLQKAADQGLPQAQLSLGLCYQKGIGGDKDPVQARACYLKAAEQGFPQAQYKLGYCYHHGIGGDKDLALAIDYYRKAAAQNYPSAITAFRNILSFSQDKSESDKASDSFIQARNTLQKNIEQILGIYELNQKRNDVNSPFQEKQTASPHLYTLYQELCFYTQQCLNIVRSLNEPEFMLSSFTIPDPVVKEELKNNPLIKVYSYKENEFITFGAENVKKANQLIEFLTYENTAYQSSIQQLSSITEEVIEDYLKKITKIQDKISLTTETENTRKRKREQEQQTERAYKIHKTLPLKDNLENAHNIEDKKIAKLKNKNEKIESKIQQYNTLIARPQELKEAFEETRSWHKQIEDLLREGRKARTQFFLKDNPFFEKE